MALTDKQAVAALAPVTVEERLPLSQLPRALPLAATQPLKRSQPMRVSHCPNQPPRSRRCLFHLPSWHLVPLKPDLDAHRLVRPGARETVAHAALVAEGAAVCCRKGK